MKQALITQRNLQRIESMEFNTLPRFKVDSLRIRIPIEKVTILDNIYLKSKKEKKDLNILEEDGVINIIDWSQLKQQHNTSISVYYDLIKMKINFTEVAEFLVVGISSKVMKERYFEGLHDLEYIYQYIINALGIYVTFEDFCAADTYDIDICMDRVMEEEVYSLLIDNLKKRAKVSNQRGAGYQVYSSKTNHGIEFGNRNNADWRKLIHFKVYDKKLELWSKSRAFTGEYLRDVEFKGVKRFETNIRNRKVLRELGVTDSSLKNIIKAETMEDLKKVFNLVYGAHLEQRKLIKSKYVSGTEQALSMLLLYGFKNGLLYEQFRAELSDSITERHLRKRTILKLDYIYSVLKEEGFEEVDLSEELQKIFLYIFPSYDEGKKGQNCTSGTKKGGRKQKKNDSTNVQEYGSNLDQQFEESEELTEEEYKEFLNGN